MADLCQPSTLIPQANKKWPQEDNCLLIDTLWWNAKPHLEDAVLLGFPEFHRSHIRAIWTLGGTCLVPATLLQRELPFVQLSLVFKDYPCRRTKHCDISRIWSILQGFVLVRSLWQEDYSHLFLDSFTGKYLRDCTEHTVTCCWQPRRETTPRTASLICWKTCVSRSCAEQSEVTRPCARWKCGTRC